MHQEDRRLPQIGRPLIWPTLAAVLAILGGALGLVILIQAERPTPGQQAAHAVERAMTAPQPPAADGDAVEDERLTGNANEAGYRWAERRGLDAAARCPAYSKGFRDGCAAYIKDQAAP